MLHASIDGTLHELPEGCSILDALRAVGIRLPALCHDDRLAPTGACRLCLVHVAGSAKPVPACTTPVTDGMAIVTDAADLEENRRTLLGLLVRHYPAYAIRRCPEKPFHRAVLEARLVPEAGLAPDAADGPPAAGLDDRSHPYIAVDMARCIDCYRCVRICDELQGQGVWHVRNRGLDTRIRPDGPTLRDSSCVGCGACVDTCPTGALEDRIASTLPAPSQWTRTVCPYCGVGCELEVGTRSGRIVAVRPRLDAAVNKGHLCVKGRYAHGFVSAADRITDPLIRGRDGWRRASWSEARALVAGRLRELIARHGPDSIGVLGSARATNEDNYVIQKFARVAVGTNNVDCCARVCHAPSAAALKQALGAGLGTNSFDDIERARTILVCGANPTENHPVVGARIRQAARRGARLIVIDPRRIELAREADSHLALNPGTTVALLHAMAHTIVAEGLTDRAFLDARVDGVDAFARFLDEWTPDRAADLCGVEADAIRDAARLYATGSPAMIVHGLGATEHVQGTDAVAALVNLALLTGNLGTAGAGVNPLRGQNNVQGAAHMGCDPATLPGSMPLPGPRGLNLIEMMDAAAAGRLQALWATGYDVLLTNPNMAATTRALRALDLVIVQDLFLTETAREVGTVFLPACSSFEREGTFMNAERRIQRVRAALRPLGASKPDWQIVCEVARTMGAQGFEFTSAEEIWDEVRARCEGARGMTYARLEERGLQWPCPADDHPGTALLHRDVFANGGRARLRTIEYRATPEAVTPLFPFVLMTGRSLYQFNAGTMTGRTPNAALRPADVLDIAPDDAGRLDIHEGDTVRLVSRYGDAILPAHLNAAMRSGQLFATFQQPEAALNAVTGPYRDAAVATPEYKVTAVRLERVSEVREARL